MTIAATFTVAWVPYQLTYIVLVYGNTDHAMLILDAVETLTYANSCANPVIYALMWRPFRLSLIEVSKEHSVNPGFSNSDAFCRPHWAKCPAYE